jgi:hypothetical protein
MLIVNLMTQKFHVCEGFQPVVETASLRCAQCVPLCPGVTRIEGMFLLWHICVDPKILNLY